ncbi:hypothetical protein PHMEG_00029790 [Phytophthora megakarya]|uniref:DUF6818 domain-containing protein n=1 Tax=Phytophthora megakarya TaxID=4795 RepID=A0A225V1D0_9STRA|nr:hypothetical protein PHMEG_00029790 [Phytophthora megakarya]
MTFYLMAWLTCLSPLGVLGIVEDILPFGAEQWQDAASQFNTNIPAGWTERDGDSLKRNFQKLVCVPKPTGDGTCPEEVRRAKRLQYAIEAAMAVVDLNDDFVEAALQSCPTVLFTRLELKRTLMLTEQQVLQHQRRLRSMYLKLQVTHQLHLPHCRLQHEPEWSRRS